MASAPISPTENDKRTTQNTDSAPPLPDLTVFFSSQNENGMREGRRFVEKALRRALEELAGEKGLEILLVTADSAQMTPDLTAAKGHEGQEELEKHFALLDNATVMVADLSGVAQTRNGRKVPSPEVMRDLGWAMARLGRERVLTVAHGGRESVVRAELTYNIAHSGDAQRAFQELSHAFRESLTRKLLPRA